MPQDSPTKRCYRCGEYLPLSSFSKDRQTRDGLNRGCRACRSAVARESRNKPENKARERARQKRHYEENRDLRKAQATEWQKRNPDKVKAIKKAFRERHPESGRDWYLANRDTILARQRAYYEANPELRGLAQRRWDKKNPHKRAEIAARRRARIEAATVGETDFEALWVQCQGVCGICHVRIDPALRAPDPMSRSIDHITPLARGGTHEQANLQWAHLVCNIKKGAREAWSPQSEGDGSHQC